MITKAENTENFAAFLLRMRGRGLADQNLMAAIEATPRKTFVPGAYQSIAFSDRTIPIECGESIEGIDLQAMAIHKLELDRKHRVLEIGTGSGFTSAVMARLSARVTTLDRYKTLVDHARQRHLALSLGNVIARQADGRAGLAGEGPYDRVIIWAAFDVLPRNCVDWLTTNGIMIVPVGPPEGKQELMQLSKVGSRFERVDLGVVRFQPLAEGVAAAL